MNGQFSQCFQIRYRHIRNWKRSNKFLKARWFPPVEFLLANPKGSYKANKYISGFCINGGRSLCPVFRVLQQAGTAEFAECGINVVAHPLTFGAFFLHAFRVPDVSQFYRDDPGRNRDNRISENHDEGSDGLTDIGLG